MLIQLYKNTYDLKGVEWEHTNILKAIKSDKWKDKVDALRAIKNRNKGEENHSLYSRQKSQLPWCIFSGTFKEGRNDADILTYSGMMVLDIDHIEQIIINKLKDKFKTDSNIYCAFVSPGGEGLKIIVKVDSQPTQILIAFKQLEKYFSDNYGISIDPSGKNVARLCFVSYDPDIYINDNASVIHIETNNVDTSYTKTYSVPSALKGRKIERNVYSIFDVCVNWVERKYHFVPGQRNMYIYCLACIMNRTGITLEDALYLSADKYVGESFLQSELVSTISKAYRQRKSEFNTVDIVGVEQDAPPDINAFVGADERVPLDELTTDISDLTQTLLSSKVPNPVIKQLINSYTSHIWGGADNLSEIMNGAYMESIEQEKSLEVMSFSDMAKTILERNRTDGHVKTYIDAIDKVFGGHLMTGNAYALIGVGETFKSILAMWSAINNAIHGIDVIYCNSEMSMYQMMNRLASAICRIDLVSYELTPEYEDILSKCMQKVNEVTGDRLHIFNGRGFSRKSLKGTCARLKRKNNRPVQMIIMDGISQMDSLGKEEIPALIYNSQECKEIAKDNDCVVIWLSHTSGGVPKYQRDTSENTRGGAKMVANTDGYICTSRLIDPIAFQENPEDLIYKEGLLYVRARDKRGGGGEVNKIIRIHKPLFLEELSENPMDFEVRFK